MLPMLSLSTPRRSSLSVQLLRHFSIRVSSLKKQSLVAQLLRGNGSPKLTKFKSLDPRSHGAKATQPGEASVSQPSPLGVSVESPVLQNGTQQEQRLVEDDACIAKLSVRSKKESKEVQHRDVAAKLSVPSLREGRRAHYSDGGTQLSVLPKLSLPSLREGSKALHNVGDTQPSVRAQTCSKRGRYGDAKLFQTESRKVEPAKVSALAGEDGHRSHSPVESKPGSRDGKRLALQTRGVSPEPCLPISKLGISPLRTGSSKEISSLASQIGDEPGKCITGNVSTTERGEEGDEQNAITHTLSLKKSVPSVGREASKQLKVKSFVEVGTTTDNVLHDLQRKIELVNVESALPTHVKALITKKAFRSESPEKLAEVLTVLKLFFQSGDKACQILTGNSRIIVQPLEQLQKRLQVLVEFEVDKATCYKLGTSCNMMTLKVENYRSVLSFLKELGLSAESRNRMICKYPPIMRRPSEMRMQLNVNFLESIKAARPSLLKLLESRPYALCRMMDKNLMDMHKVFQHVGLSSKEFVKALSLLTQYSPTHYFSRYNLFREQGFSDEAFASMIKQCPNILTMSEESLKAKLHFLLHTAKGDISEILMFPRYFNFSLASRIIPRLKILEELNLPRRPRLSAILVCKKLDFTTLLNIADSSKCI